MDKRIEKALENSQKLLTLRENDLQKRGDPGIDGYVNDVHNFIELIEQTAMQAIKDSNSAGLALKSQLENIHEDTLTWMLKNPRKTMENVMRIVERRKKTECSDGAQNSRWSLEFSLLARLQMAWKLVFK